LQHTNTKVVLQWENLNGIITAWAAPVLVALSAPAIVASLVYYSKEKLTVRPLGSVKSFCKVTTGLLLLQSALSSAKLPAQGHFPFRKDLWFPYGASAVTTDLPGRDSEIFANLTASSKPNVLRWLLWKRGVPVPLPNSIKDSSSSLFLVVSVVAFVHPHKDDVLPAIDTVRH